MCQQNQITGSQGSHCFSSVLFCYSHTNKCSCLEQWAVSTGRMMGNGLRLHTSLDLGRGVAVGRSSVVMAKWKQNKYLLLNTRSVTHVQSSVPQTGVSQRSSSAQSFNHCIHTNWIPMLICSTMWKFIGVICGFKPSDVVNTMFVFLKQLHCVFFTDVVTNCSGRWTYLEYSHVP